MASYKVRRRYHKTSVLDTGTTARRYYKYGDIPNVDVVGAPTINGMVVSGFSTANYVLTRPQAIIKYTPTADNWEMVFKINFVVSSAIQSIWCCGDAGYCARLRVNTSEKITFQGGNSTQSYNVFNITGTTTLVAGTDYWIKCEFTGSAYNLYSSTDNQTWTLEGTKASTTKLTYGGHEVLGFDRANAKYPLTSSLDLSECYYKVNGEYLWRGKQAEPATENDYDYYEEYKVVSTYCPDYVDPPSDDEIIEEEPPELPSTPEIDSNMISITFDSTSNWSGAAGVSIGGVAYPPADLAGTTMEIPKDSKFGLNVRGAAGLAQSNYKLALTLNSNTWTSSFVQISGSNLAGAAVNCTLSESGTLSFSFIQ